MCFSVKLFISFRAHAARSPPPLAVLSQKVVQEMKSLWFEGGLAHVPSTSGPSLRRGNPEGVIKGCPALQGTPKAALPTFLPVSKPCACPLPDDLRGPWHLLAPAPSPAAKHPPPSPGPALQALSSFLSSCRRRVGLQAATGPARGTPPAPPPWAALLVAALGNGLPETPKGSAPGLQSLASRRGIETRTSQHSRSPVARGLGDTQEATGQTVPQGTVRFSFVSRVAGGTGCRAAWSGNGRKKASGKFTGLGLVAALDSWHGEVVPAREGAVHGLQALGWAQGNSRIRGRVLPRGCRARPCCVAPARLATSVPAPGWKAPLPASRCFVTKGFQPRNSRAALPGRLPGAEPRSGLLSCLFSSVTYLFTSTREHQAQSKALPQGDACFGSRRQVLSARCRPCRSATVPVPRR
ncbi:uncharacterized protein LOC135329353 [Dromaius novaehollandiae]|uniref:uncharacterized protein LOC135329353 n=1 Tax=Dromaius novaehollandiae TaxID=8790 RepID=UPI00311E24F4